MVSVRLHPGQSLYGPPVGGSGARGHGRIPIPPSPAAPPPAEAGGRLNLLLSCASWRSDSWADRLPQLLEPLGIRSVRARTGREAERTIRTLRVHIAVVDLGLPLDESPRENQPAPEAGPRILELLRRLEDPPPTVVIKGPRPTRDDVRHLSAALRFDAFAVVDRAAADVELMLKIFQRCLARYYQDRWPESPPGGGERPQS